jgi:hypothetical protein
MKNIMESAETFEAYAVIDCCYYGLKELNKEIGKTKDGLSLMIDKATGFSEHQNKKWIETSIELLNQIIESKKLIEADYKNDSKMLAEIEALANES